MVFTKRNYVLLTGAILVVVAGYVMMRVDNQVDGFISLYIAPVLILGGYIAVMYAIFSRDKPAPQESGDAQS